MSEARTKELVVSEVPLIFDDNLVNFVKEIQSKYDFELHATNPMNREYEAQILFQKELNQYIFDNQHRLNFSKPTTLVANSWKTFPSLYALHLCIISKIDDCRDLYDAIKQTCPNYIESLIDASETLKLDNKSDISANIYSGESDTFCVCSHPCCVENLYYRKNKLTNIMMIVGSDCIDKDKILNEDNLKRAKSNAKNTAFYKKKQIRLANERAEKKGIIEVENQRKKTLSDEKKADDFVIDSMSGFYVLDCDGLDQDLADIIIKKIEDKFDECLGNIGVYEHFRAGISNIHPSVVNNPKFSCQIYNCIFQFEMKRLHPEIIVKKNYTFDEANAYRNSITYHTKPQLKVDCNKINYIDEPRVYLFGVTYHNKESAKDLGARWDAIRKQWYATGNYTLSKKRLIENSTQFKIGSTKNDTDINIYEL